MFGHSEPTTILVNAGGTPPHEFRAVMKLQWEDKVGLVRPGLLNPTSPVHSVKPDLTLRRPDCVAGVCV